MKRCFLALLTAAVTNLPAGATEVHSETGDFSGHGVVLAWAVARGPDESRTHVVVRVVTEAPIRAMVVRGRDPVARTEQILVPETPTGGGQHVRIPRASLAEFPRIEWSFYDTGRRPRLVVFYLGVPKTAPEFADEARLEAYLAERTSPPRAAASPSPS